LLQKAYTVDAFNSPDDSFNITTIRIAQGKFFLIIQKKQVVLCPERNFTGFTGFQLARQ